MDFRELDSTVQINESNTLQVEYNLSAIEKYLDIVSNGIVCFPKDVSCSTNVRTWGFSSVNSSCYLYKNNDISSHVHIPYISYIESIAKIIEVNVLNVIYNLAQAPIHTLTNYIIQDVYIRQSRPTLNYGTSQSFIIGNSVDGEYRTLIQADLTQYNNLTDALMIDANLILNLYGNFNQDLIIDAYEVNTNWTENNVTWNSALSYNISNSPIFSFSCNSSIVKINILDYISELKLNGNTKFNILLKVRNQVNGTFSFFSKDALDITVRPRIDIKYQDLNWIGFSSQSDINSSASVKSKDNKDLSNSTIIKQKKIDDVIGSILIGRWESEDISSTSNVIRFSLLDSVVNVSIKKEIDSNVSISGYEFAEVDSNIGILSKSYLDSNSNIFKKHDLDSNGSIRSKDFKNIDSVCNIFLSSDINSNLFINPNCLLDSIIYVRRSNNNDIDSTSNVNYEIFIDCICSILKNKHLDSYSTILYSKNLESISNIIPNRDISSFVKIYHTNNLDSNSRISFYSEIQNNVLINQKNSSSISSTVNVVTRSFVDLESNGLIFEIQNNHCILDSIANISPNKDISAISVIRSKSWSDIESDAVFRQFDINEIDSETYVMMGLTNKQLDCNSIIQKIGIDLIDAIVIIQSNSRRWVPGIHGKDVFKGSNSKLPRIWRKEDFIK